MPHRGWVLPLTRNTLGASLTPWVHSSNTYCLLSTYYVSGRHGAKCFQEPYNAYANVLLLLYNERNLYSEGKVTQPVGSGAGMKTSQPNWKPGLLPATLPHLLPTAGSDPSSPLCPPLTCPSAFCGCTCSTLLSHPFPLRKVRMILLTDNNIQHAQLLARITAEMRTIKSLRVTQSVNWVVSPKYGFLSLLSSNIPVDQ